MIKEKFGLSKKDQEIILKTLGRFTEVEEVILFGSRALGNYKPGSDIDLALKGNVEDIYLELKSVLNEETPLPYNFDVMVYHNIKNENLKKHIDDWGKIIYKRSISITID